MKMRFLIFTKTRWDELPRIRHQVAWMLRDHGHDVVFMEKSSPIWHGGNQFAKDNIQLIRYPELIHHQLRIINSFVEVNAKFTSKWIIWI